MKLRSLTFAVATCLGVSLLGAVVPAAAIASTPIGAAAPTASSAPVTSGSYLAVVEHGPDAEYGGIAARSQQLLLVSPSGGTSEVYSRRVSPTFGGFTLLDWSVDGRTALLTFTRKTGSRVVAVDLATGTTEELEVPLLSTAVLDPAGTGILAATWKGRESNTQVLDRISWSGTRTRLLGGTSGSLLAGRDGTVLTTAVGHGRVQLLLSASTGAVVNRIHTPGYCNLVRWWDATRVLATCGNHSDLYLLDPATGSTDRLTKGHGRGDYGHMDARYAGDRLYVQAAGACGYTFVARVTPGGTRQLKVPGAVGSVVMVDAVGDDLVLEHAASCDGDRPRAVLSLFDPVHHVERPLVTLGRHEGFGAIRVLGEVRASAY